MMIRYLKVIIAILLFLLSSTAAFGLSKPTVLQDLKVSIWPEYDKANEALVMFRGKLPDNVQLPAKVRFLFPNSAKLSSTSSVNNNDQFQYTKEWNSKNIVQRGNFIELTYNVYYPTFQFEIYDSVDTQKNKREFSFPLKTAMDINNLSVEVQQPLRSDNFKASPKSTSNGTDEKGFNFETYELGKIKAGAQKNFSATYTKSDTKPSVEGENAQPVDTSASQIPSIWIIIIIVATLLAIPAAIFFRPGRRASMSDMVKAGSSSGKSAKTRGGRFCTQCGTRLNPGSSFCHTCGKKL